MTALEGGLGGVVAGSGTPCSVAVPLEGGSTFSALASFRFSVASSCPGVPWVAIGTFVELN